MRAANIIVGVDIGTSKVSVVIGQAEEDSVNILGVSEIEAKGIRKGQIVDIVEAASSLNQALDTAERMAGASIDSTFVAISGSHIESQNSKGVVAIASPDHEIGPEDVDRVLEAAGAISLPSTRTIIHVLPKTFTVDGESGIKDPVGMSGVRLEVDTHIITANTTTVRNIQRLLEQEAGVRINALVFSGFASSLSTLSDTEKELGVVMADMGAGVTNVAVFVEGTLAFSRVIPIGARHITNDLAIGLRVSLESAEKIKIHLGKRQNPRSIDDTDELDLTGLGIDEELKKVSNKTLIEGIIRPRLNELFTMIGIELKKSKLGTQTPAGIVLTGGGALTVGAEEAAKRMLAMPVRIGYPHSITGLIDDVENPGYATVLGLLIFGKNFRSVEEGSFLDGLIPDLSAKSFIGGKGLKGLLKKFGL